MCQYGVVVLGIGWMESMNESNYFKVVQYWESNLLFLCMDVANKWRSTNHLGQLCATWLCGY